MEWNGTPIDVDTRQALRGQWPSIPQRLGDETDADYGVYDGRAFKIERSAARLARNGIPWPRLERGEPALDRSQVFL